MNVTFAEQPMPYGPLHIFFLILAVILNIVIYRTVRDKSEDALLNILTYTGLAMMIAEVFKQIFCYVYYYNCQISFEHFPWQLCSMAMYLSFIVCFVKGKKQEAVLVYLSTFSLFGAVMALLFPGIMLAKEVFITVHSFLYHTLIIAEAVIAILILQKRKQPQFKGALKLFGITAAIAEMINILTKFMINDPAREADMFYINPFYPSTQPILSDLSLKYGNVTEVIIYLISICVISYLIFLAETKLFYTKEKS